MSLLQNEGGLGPAREPGGALQRLGPTLANARGQRRPDAPSPRLRSSVGTGRAGAQPMTSLIVEINGTDLPGRRCGPSPEGRMYEDVHVGLARRGDTVELVRGDARLARWEFEVKVRRDENGTLDFGGPFVHGRRGERSFGLRWGTLAWDDSFDVFRAAKLRLSDVEAELIEHALSTGGRLVASLGLTDEDGYPVCASVRPPEVSWSATNA